MEDEAHPPPVEELGFIDFDPDYEFDAPRFFDFSVSEFRSDIDFAESWFRSASSCPPSPYAIELMWRIKEAHCSDASSVFEQVPSSENASIVSNTTGCLSAQNDLQIGLASLKTGVKKKLNVSKGSTLMKPTASHLAKLSKRKEVSKPARPQTHSLKNNETSLQNSVNQDQATKRQKLESGYLHKVSHLNHQNVCAHKKSTEVTQLSKKSVDPRNLTIPREPKFETARRALIRRRKDAAQHDHDMKSTAQNLKAHPTNKKVLRTPSVPLQKRTATFSEFQGSRLKISEQALQHSAANVISMPESISISQTESTISERNSTSISSYANSPTRQRSKAAIHDKEYISLMGKKTSHVPPIELFSKLSLLSKRQHETSNENFCRQFRSE